MRFSIYPTDSDETKDEVLRQAKSAAGNAGKTSAAGNVCKTSVAGNAGNIELFTSLHIPESAGLKQYLCFLKGRAAEGFSFFADISPLAFERLEIDAARAGVLRDYGITGLRLDFGFSLEEMAKIAASGLQIAINAGTVDAETVGALLPYKPIGWHNYYPRPETGIPREFFLSQNAIFASRGLELRGFIPGDKDFRAPLCLGLPTLESQRYKNTYCNYVEIKSLCPAIELYCAEGALYPEHLDWINKYDADGVVTLPLSTVDGAIAETLYSRVFNLRPDSAELSFRLEGTRSGIAPLRRLESALREKGSVQMDNPLFSRYQGELHIMRQDAPLVPFQNRVADIAAPYRSLVNTLSGGALVRFTRGNLCF